MNKKALGERDICTKLITPSIVAAGLNVDTQVHKEVDFTDGRITSGGKSIRVAIRKHLQSGVLMVGRLTSYIGWISQTGKLVKMRPTALSPAT